MMKIRMRMIVIAAALAGAVVGGSLSAEGAPADKKKAKITLSDARSRIDKAIESPKVLTEIMQGLEAADQVKFLADVNKAIGDMPASVEEKSALYLNANHAAIKAAASGNVPALTAEVFATVPPESLTVISERFAIDLFNRSSDPKVTYTDEQYTKIALDLMKVINDRTAETDNASARSAFAILMLIRASNGSPEDLADKLIDTLENDEAKDLARTEWIPAALGKDGREQGYEPLLASADAGRRPDLDFVLVIAGPQYLESILEDIVGKNTDQMAFMRTRTPVLDAVENKLLHMIPTFGGDYPGAVGETGGPIPPPPELPVPPAPPKPPEPVPYNGQVRYGKNR